MATKGRQRAENLYTQSRTDQGEVLQSRDSLSRALEARRQESEALKSEQVEANARVEHLRDSLQVFEQRNARLEAKVSKLSMRPTRTATPGRSMWKSGTKMKIRDKTNNRDDTHRRARKSWQKSEAAAAIVVEDEPVGQSAEEQWIHNWVKGEQESSIADLMGNTTITDNAPMDVSFSVDIQEEHSARRAPPATGSVDRNTRDDQVAHDAFDKDFPNGYKTIHTRSDGLRCGLDAVVESMEALYPSMPRPTVEDLEGILESQEFQASFSDFRVEGEVPFSMNDFSGDEIGAVLNRWAAIHWSVLRIGYVVNDQPPRHYLTPHDDDHATVVWIHNDNAAAELGNNVCGHWSGMDRK